MSKARINPHVFRDPSWPHWAATIPLLAGHITGIGSCLEGAVTLCVCMDWSRSSPAAPAAKGSCFCALPHPQRPDPVAPVA